MKTIFGQILVLVSACINLHELLFWFHIDSHTVMNLTLFYPLPCWIFLLTTLLNFYSINLHAKHVFTE